MVKKGSGSDTGHWSSFITSRYTTSQPHICKRFMPNKECQQESGEGEVITQGADGDLH